MELFLVRHGESLGNVLPEDMPDAPLTELGQRQAARVADALAGEGISRIVASPLVRALGSAQPLARRLRLPIDVWKETVEVRRLGPYVGPPLQELIARFPEARFCDDLEPDGWHYPGNESAQAAFDRARQVADSLRERCSGDDRVALFSHGTFMRYLLYALLEIAPTERVRFRQENGCVHRLTLTEDGIRVNCLGDVRHLDGLAEAAARPPA